MLVFTVFMLFTTGFIYTFFFFAGMMNCAPSPGSYSQSSLDSQDSSSSMSAPSPVSVTASPHSYQNILVLSPDQVGSCSQYFHSNTLWQYNFWICYTS